MAKERENRTPAHHWTNGFEGHPPGHGGSLLQKIYQLGLSLYTLAFQKWSFLTECFSINTFPVLSKVQIPTTQCITWPSNVPPTPVKSSSVLPTSPPFFLIVLLCSQPLDLYDLSFKRDFTAKKLLSFCLPFVVYCLLFKPPWFIFPLFWWGNKHVSQ